MVGPNFQKWLSHEITVKSPVRFALAFRNVSDEHDATTEKREEATKKGKGKVNVNADEGKGEPDIEKGKGEAKTAKRKRQVDE